MITVLQVVRHWAHEYDYERIHLIAAGGAQGQSGVRFFGVVANEPDPFRHRKSDYGCPDITNRDATAFTGIDKRFDDILAELQKDEA